MLFCACPYILLAGTYYTSITNFIQGYIDNEINLNGEQTCGGTCNDYKSTKHHHCQDYTICDHSNFKRTKCTGDIFDCSTIDSDGVACLVVCIYSIKFNVDLSPFICRLCVQACILFHIPCYFPHSCNALFALSLTGLLISAFGCSSNRNHYFLYTDCRKTSGKIDDIIM